MSQATRRSAVARITNKRGLHARAAAKIVEAAARFKSEIIVKRDGQSVNARSIMGLMMLAAAPGAVLRLSATGREAEAAVTALAKLIECKFDED